LSAPFNWKWTGQDGDGEFGLQEFGLQLDIYSIIRQAQALEEEATREAVIAWLREHGYTVEKKEEE
jgi:hypothetical protein